MKGEMEYGDHKSYRMDWLCQLEESLFDTGSVQ